MTPLNTCVPSSKLKVYKPFPSINTISSSTSYILGSLYRFPDHFNVVSIQPSPPRRIRRVKAMCHLRGERPSPPMSPVPVLTPSGSSRGDPTPPRTPTSTSSTVASYRSASSQVARTTTNTTELSLRDGHARPHQGGRRIAGEDSTSSEAAELNIHPLLRRSAAAADDGLRNTGTQEAKSPQLSLFPESNDEATLEAGSTGNIRHSSPDRHRGSSAERDAEDKLEEEAFWRLGRETIQARIREKFAEMERTRQPEQVNTPSDVQAEKENGRAGDRSARESLIKRTWSTMSRKRKEK